MKKNILVLVISIVVIASSVLIYHALTPKKSDILYKQYEAFIASIDQVRYRASAGYRFEIDNKLTTWQVDLAQAFIEDKRPDDAIPLLEGLIESLNKDQYVLGEKVARNPGQVRYLAIYHEKLAACYDLKHDMSKKVWAMQKGDEYRREAARLERFEGYK
jgi:hypothetical protein